MTDFPVPIRQVVTLLDDDAYNDQWRPALNAGGIPVFEIDVQDVRDEAAFFERAAVGIRLEGVPLRTWSGLEDYLWEKLVTAPAENVLIVMRHAEAMAQDALGELLEAVSVFRDLIRATGPDATSFPGEIALRLVITGKGPSFPAG